MKTLETFAEDRLLVKCNGCRREFWSGPFNGWSPFCPTCQAETLGWKRDGILRRLPRWAREPWRDR